MKGIDVRKRTEKVHRKSLDFRGNFQWSTPFFSKSAHLETSLILQGCCWFFYMNVAIFNLNSLSLSHPVWYVILFKKKFET